MEKKHTIMLWLKDFKDVPGLPEKFTNLIRAGNIKVEEAHKTYLRISGTDLKISETDTAFTALYDPKFKAVSREVTT